MHVRDPAMVEAPGAVGGRTRCADFLSGWSLHLFYPRRTCDSCMMTPLQTTKYLDKWGALLDHERRDKVERLEVLIGTAHHVCTGC